MDYNKPELTVLNRAVRAIESGQNKSSIYRDSVDVNEMNATSTAYESDE